MSVADPKSLNAEMNALRDEVLEFAATICEGVTSWGLPTTKLSVAQSTQKFCAKTIRAQKSDSPERAKFEKSQGE